MEESQKVHILMLWKESVFMVFKHPQMVKLPLAGYRIEKIRVERQFIRQPA